MPSQPEREREQEGEREDREELKRLEDASDQFSGGEWDLSQGDPKVGEFLIRIARGGGRRGDGGVQ